MSPFVCCFWGQLFSSVLCLHAFACIACIGVYTHLLRSAEVSFVSHEAVCAALAMNGRPLPRRGGALGGGGPRGDRAAKGPLTLKVQLPPPDSLDACFSKFRSGGLGGPSSAAAAGSPTAAAAADAQHRRGPAATAAPAGGSPLSRGPSGGGPQGGPRSANLDNKWRKKGRATDAPTNAPAAAPPVPGGSKEQQQEHASSSSSSSSGSSSSSSSSGSGNTNGTAPTTPLVAPKDLLKEQLKPQG